jgi:3-deoxy-manno-octulosonate cytidylyltransferase (CMP-KDO synthetase)
MAAIIVIPARYDSVRFPGKPLVDINGKPMIVRVYNRCIRVKNAGTFIVATDDERIRDVIWGQCPSSSCIITSKNINSGTDRVSEIMKAFQDKDLIVVNVQGDLPFVDPVLIEQIINRMECNPMIDVLTPVNPCFDQVKRKDENCVKAYFDKYDNAIWFSRETPKTEMFWKHIGIYGFRNQALQRFSKTPQAEFELKYSLEQLRLLNNDFAFRILKTNRDCGQDINTEEDLKYFIRRKDEKENKTNWGDE